MTLRPLLLLTLLLGTACAGPDRRGPGAPVPQGADTVAAVVQEAFVTAPRHADELDSLASWMDGAGHTRVIATAKSSHRLLVFDGSTGELLDAIGTRGHRSGEFDRPNGIAVHGDTLFVVERDARRVQMLRLPGFTPLGSFGSGELRSPYGIWLHEMAPGTLEVYVTDSFMDGPDHRVLPPAHQLDRRVRRYRVTPAAGTGQLEARRLGAFGATRGGGVLHMVESIAGDPAQARLLIADEDRSHGATLHAYTFDGRYSGHSLPPATFDGEPEGVALWDCGPGAGYWLAVDQARPHSIFHLFDRTSLAPRGSFRGTVTANTDGIALHAAATPRFPSGVLYAVHDDRALAAFDLGELIAALGLDPACAR